MNGFVTAGAPAGTLAQLSIVGNPANQDAAAWLNLLKMAFQAQVGIPFGEHLGVDAAVRGMAGGAAFTQRLMLEHKRPLLRGMAFQTVFILGKQLGAAPAKATPWCGG